MNWCLKYINTLRYRQAQIAIEWGGGRRRGRWNFRGGGNGSPSILWRLSIASQHHRSHNRVYGKLWNILQQICMSPESLFKELILQLRTLFERMLIQSSQLMERLDQTLILMLWSGSLDVQVRVRTWSHGNECFMKHWPVQKIIILKNKK